MQALENFKTALGADVYDSLKGKFSESQIDTIIKEKTNLKEASADFLILKGLLEVDKFFVKQAQPNPPSANQAPKKTHLTNPTNVEKGLPFDTVGNFVDVSHLVTAGLGIEHDKFRFYTRNESTEIWKRLVGAQSLFLTGPPGTGKSTIVWAWCCWYALQAGVPICWIHIDRKFRCSVVDFDSGSFTAGTYPLEALPAIIEETPSAVALVVDGLTYHHMNILGHASMWQDRVKGRLVLVSSLLFHLHAEDYAQMKMEKYETVGWQEDDYYNACKDPAFLTLVQRCLDADSTASDLSEMISAKYFIAGASARWMFGFKADAAIVNIQDCIRQVHSLQELMQGLCGDRSKAIVNHLVSTTKDGSVLVSQLVARELAKRCQSPWIREATNMASLIKNNAFDGWIFQMDFISRLFHAIQHSTSITFVNTTEEWKAAGKFEFTSDQDLCNQLQIAGTNTTSLNNFWFIPLKVNQGCYDLLQLTGNTLRMIQLTVAKDHSLKLRYLISVISNAFFRNKIEIHSLDIVVITPPAITFKMSPSKVESDKADLIKMLKWDFSQLRDFKFKRANQM